MRRVTNVLTLQLDERSQAHFEDLRQRHFPPRRNQVPAHLTLFHTVPDTEEVERGLEAEAAGQAAFPLAVVGVRSLGNGVAYTLESGQLMALHARLAGRLREHLTAQDRQRLQPHIVVQNKVAVVAARELLTRLQQEFEPREVRALGFDLWHYLGGPWELARSFPFEGAEAPDEFRIQS